MLLLIIVKIAADIVPGFDVHGWFPALLFSLIVSIVTSLIEGIIGTPKATDENR